MELTTAQDEAAASAVTARQQGAWPSGAPVRDFDRAVDLHVGRRMRARRKMLGLSQQQIALACGVRFQQIQKYECGANRLSAGRLWRLSAVLGVPVGYFFDGLAMSDFLPIERRARA